MIAEFFSGFFGDAGFEPVRTDHLEGRTLSDLLPYRVYDPEKDLYFTDTGMGFIVEIEPQVSTAETASNLHSAIMTAMPSSAGLQVIN